MALLTIRQGTLEDVILLSYLAAADSSNRMAGNYRLCATSNNTLLHSFLYKEGFAVNFSVLELDSAVIGGASFYILDNGNGVLLSRSFVVKRYRSSWYLTELLKHQMSKCSADVLVICFNSPTSSVYKYLERHKKGLLPDVWSNFKPVGQRLINCVEQYVIEYDKTLAT
jgi:hypothetical protein